LRALLRRLRFDNPRASKAELQDLYMAEYRQDDDFIEEAGIRVFGNDYNSLLEQQETEPQPQQHSAPARQPQPIRQPQPVRPRRQVSDADLAAVGQRLRSIVLLDLVEANGKKLGDCTGGELRALGGWRIKIADRIGDDSAITRKHISEAAARELCDSSIGR
jgi:hypothetical protein